MNLTTIALLVCWLSALRYITLSIPIQPTVARTHEKRRRRKGLLRLYYVSFEVSLDHQTCVIGHVINYSRYPIDLILCRRLSAVVNLKRCY